MPRIKVVGAGTPSRTPNRWGTCFLLEIGGEWLMIDCGPAATYKMYQMGVSPTEIEHLFFTHLHSDHISDYPCFLMTRFDQCNGTQPDLQVYGPEPIKDVTERIWSKERGALWYDVVARTNHPMSVHAYHTRGGQGDRPEPVIHVHEYTNGKVASGKTWECTALEVKHAQPYINCYGFRFETEEGVIAFSGDTAPTEAVVELARDADMFVQEIVRREADIADRPSRISETGSIGAAKMAAEAGAKRMLVNHQGGDLENLDAMAVAIQDVKAHYDGPLYWAQDFTEVEW